MQLAGGAPGWGPESLQRPEAAWGPQEDQEDGLEAKTTVQRKHDVWGEYLMLWGNVFGKTANDQKDTNSHN